MYSYRSRKECLLAFSEKVFEFMFTENLRQSIERRHFLIENCLPSKNSLEPCKYLCVAWSSIEANPLAEIFHIHSNLIKEFMIYGRFLSSKKCKQLKIIY